MSAQVVTITMDDDYKKRQEEERKRQLEAARQRQITRLKKEITDLEKLKIEYSTFSEGVSSLISALHSLSGNLQNTAVHMSKALIVANSPVGETSLMESCNLAKNYAASLESIQSAVTSKMNTIDSDIAYRRADLSRIGG